MKVLPLMILIIFALLGLAGLGFQVKPKPFSMPSLATFEMEAVPIPAGLPGPVERFYRAAYGERIPRVDTAVFTGRGKIRPFGIWMPVRFVFVHNAGKDYRHYIEATFFGLPLLKVNEGYLDGRSFFESPMGSYTDDASTNQAANLAVWAEAGWFPSIWVTDERVRWESVDETTALLYVPFEEKMENFVVRFNPQTGLIDTMEAMRYRDQGDDASKVLWITRNEAGASIPGTKLSATGSATWLDQGKPWAYFTLEEALYNADVSETIRQRGW